MEHNLEFLIILQQRMTKLLSKKNCDYLHD